MSTSKKVENAAPKNCLVAGGGPRRIVRGGRRLIRLRGQREFARVCCCDSDNGWGSRNFRERFFESCAPWCLGGHVLKLLCESFAKVATLECKSFERKLLGSGTKVVFTLTSPSVSQQKKKQKKRNLTKISKGYEIFVRSESTQK